MSVPLPRIYKIEGEPSSQRHHVNDIFLDPEERYDIFVVKSAERPHLVSYSSSDNDENVTTPITDGCDLPGWRKEGLALPSSKIPDDIRSLFFVGPSCTMLRRETQWTYIPTAALHMNRFTSTWEEKLQILPYDNFYETVDYHSLDESTWNYQYEAKNVPVKILNATVNWKCMPKYDSSDFPKSGNRHQHCMSNNNRISIDQMFSGGGSGGWTFMNLLKRFGNDVRWRFSDTHGEMLTLETYAKYIVSVDGGYYDDSPLGIYDSEFGDDDSVSTNILVEEYTVPKYFQDDIFRYCSERPPFRWILMGPSRSGTGLHIDPLYTHAWVTLLQGKKRWMLFPPSTPPDHIGMDQQHQIPSIIWFRDYYDKVTSSVWPTEWKPTEIIQLPGETVFVPAGWPHMVVNLELSVAITHNYASQYSPFLTTMWKDMTINEPLFAKQWIESDIPSNVKAKIVNFHQKALDNKELWAQHFTSRYSFLIQDEKKE